MACLPTRLVGCLVLAYSVSFGFYTQGRPPSHEMHTARFAEVSNAAGCPFCFSFQACPANQARQQHQHQQEQLAFKQPLLCLSPSGQQSPQARAQSWG